jgi:hypothetical protein
MRPCGLVFTSHNIAVLERTIRLKRNWNKHINLGGLRSHFSCGDNEAKLKSMQELNNEATNGLASWRDLDYTIAVIEIGGNVKVNHR